MELKLNNLWYYNPWLTRGLHPNGFSLSELPSGSPEIALVGTPATLEPHNFASKP